MKRLRGVDVPSARRRPSVPKPRAGTSADSAVAKVRTSSPKNRASAQVQRGANCPVRVSNYTADRVVSRARTPFADPNPSAAPSQADRVHLSTTPARPRARMDRVRVRRARKTVGRAAISCRPGTPASSPPVSTRSAAGRRRHRRNRWCTLPARSSPLPITSSRVRASRLPQSRPRPSRKRCATRHRAPTCRPRRTRPPHNRIRLPHHRSRRRASGRGPATSTPHPHGSIRPAPTRAANRRSARVRIPPQPRHQLIPGRLRCPKTSRKMASSRRPHRHHPQRPRAAPTRRPHGSTNRTRAESTARPRSTHPGSTARLRESENRTHRALMASTDRPPDTMNRGRTTRAESTVRLRDSTSHGRARVRTTRARNSTNRAGLARTGAMARRSSWTGWTRKVTMVRRLGSRHSGRRRIRPLTSKVRGARSGLSCHRHQGNSTHSRPPVYPRTLVWHGVPGRRRMNRAVRIRMIRRERSVQRRPRTTQRVPPRAIARNPPVRHRYSIPRRSIRPGGRVAPPGCPAPPPRSTDAHRAAARIRARAPATPQADRPRAQHRPRAAVHRTTTASTARRRKPPTTIRLPRGQSAREQHLRHRDSSNAPHPHHKHPAASSTSRPWRRRELISKGPPVPEIRNPVGRNAIAGRPRPDGSPAPIRRALSSRNRGHRRHRAGSSDVRARDRREPQPNPSGRPGRQDSLDPLRRNEDVSWPRLVGLRIPSPERRAYRRPSLDGTGCHRKSTRPPRRTMTPQRRPTLRAISRFRRASSRRRMGRATEQVLPERSNPQYPKSSTATAMPPATCSPHQDKHRAPGSRIVSGTTELDTPSRPLGRHLSAIRPAHHGRSDLGPQDKHPSATRPPRGRTDPGTRTHPPAKHPAATNHRGRAAPWGKHPAAIAHRGKVARRPQGKHLATMRHGKADMHQRVKGLAISGRAARYPRGRCLAATRHCRRADPSGAHPAALKCHGRVDPRGKAPEANTHRGKADSRPQAMHLAATKHHGRAAQELRAKHPAAIRPHHGRADPGTRNRTSGRRRSAIKSAHPGRADPRGKGPEANTHRGKADSRPRAKHLAATKHHGRAGLDL